MTTEVINYLRSVGKALSSMVITAAAYLIGVTPSDGNLSDLSTIQWLGLVIFMGSAYGITYITPNRDPEGTRQSQSVQPQEEGDEGPGQHRAE